MSRRVGLFGGSFNPAHEGHRHVALTALKRLRLDQIWWIVARGNPLKSDHGDYKARLASAQARAQHPRMHVSDIEARLGLTYSVDTISAVQSRNRGTRFVWIMGSDSYHSFHRWRDWQVIAQRVPIAIIARPGHRPTASPFSQRFVRHKIKEVEAPLLADLPAPAWVWLKAPFHKVSSTEIRRRDTWRPDNYPAVITNQVT